jgi:3D (Asp-Asp-Asp) domain-containing protein
MALHISGKLMSLGIVLAALITAFSAPRSEPVLEVDLALSPYAVITETSRLAPETLVTAGPEANPRFVLRATGYNSLESQTDSTPFITATGARTRFGIVAVSRDLLGDEFPYGSLVRIRDLGNYYTGRGAGAVQAMLDQQGLFIVEDTMHARKTNQIDVWFPAYGTAVNWGVRKIEVELVRYGRSGPELFPVAASDFEAAPYLLAAR